MNALLDPTPNKAEPNRVWVSGLALTAVGMLALVYFECAAADALTPSGDNGSSTNCPCLLNGGEPGPDECPCDIGQCISRCVQGSSAQCSLRCTLGCYCDTGVPGCPTHEDPGPTPTIPPVFCPGDCNDDGVVTIDELLTLVNVALGATDMCMCVRGNTDRDRVIAVDEIVRAVGHSLDGCGL